MAVVSPPHADGRYRLQSGRTAVSGGRLVLYCMAASAAQGGRHMTGVSRVIRRLAVCGAIALLGLLFLLFAIGFVVNSHDESLTPETLALLATPSNPYKPEQNIYLALEGFDAPPDRSVLAAGQATVALYDRQFEAMLRSPPTASADLAKPNPQRLEFKGHIDFCRPLVSPCWGDLPSHKTELETLLADNRELYQRYLGLHRLQGYVETARPSYNAPLQFVPGELRSLFLADLSLRMQTGNAGQRHDALADLQSDVQLWKRVLSGEGRFESKMVAVASLHADYLVLADMIADPGAELAVALQDARDMVPFFEWDDWRIGNVFAAQSRAISSDWIRTGLMYSGEWESTQPWWRRLGHTLESHFFKFNATQNLVAQQMGRLIAVAQADPSQFHLAREVYEAWLRDNLDRFSVGTTYDPAVYVDVARDVFRRWMGHNLLSLPLTYNPAGKVLAANSVAVGFDAYLLRAYDGAALQRLAKLGYEIRRQHIDTSAIPAFLRQHPEWATHPADGRPFLWSAGTGEISIQTVAKQPAGRRFSIRVWQRSSSGS